jgi:hypothetical protein
MMTAVYTNDRTVLADFITTYGVTHWLLDFHTYQTDYLTDRESSRGRWLQEFQPLQREIQARLEAGEVPLLAQVRDRCAIYAEPGGRQILTSACILEATATLDPAPSR